MRRVMGRVNQLRFLARFKKSSTVRLSTTQTRTNDSQNTSWAVRPLSYGRTAVTDPGHFTWFLKEWSWLRVLIQSHTRVEFVNLSVSEDWPSKEINDQLARSACPISGNLRASSPLREYRETSPDGRGDKTTVMHWSTLPTPRYG